MKSNIQGVFCKDNANFIFNLLWKIPTHMFKRLKIAMKDNPNFKKCFEDNF